MTTRNVLVFPAGTEIALEIYEALRQCKEIRLFGAGLDEPSHGPFAFRDFHVVPSIYEANWLSELIALCRRLEIDYIFPAYDDVIVALARNQEHIPAVVLTASLETCLTTRSKRATYRALQHLLRVPKVFANSPLATDYPLIVKPDCGQGSQGVAIVHTDSELAGATAVVSDPLVCEYLPGEEYTVDCFSDRVQGVLFVGARIRRRIRSGIAVNTTPVPLDGAETLARRIHDALSLRGAWFFQVKRAFDGELALLEVAPRIAGSMSAHRVMGVNFPLLAIYEHERAPIRLLINRDDIELDRAFRNRFRHSINFSVLYVDLDDTLILRDQVNPDVVSLIVQSINNGIKVKLITRHSGNLTATLQRFRLMGMFDDTIQIRAGDRKSAYIKEHDAILIDDSFAERWEVHSKLGIRTFDCSMIELLLQTHSPASQKLNAR